VVVEAALSKVTPEDDLADHRHAAPEQHRSRPRPEDLGEVVKIIVE
jgi:hypothetical protein